MTGPVIMMVTDRRSTAGSLAERVGLAARAGAHLIQVREGDLEGREYVALVADCVQAVRGTRARILVNDRMDVAIAAGARGVHLRSASVPPARARQLMPMPHLIGRSVHDEDELARLAPAAFTDYVLFGTVFHTTSKPGREPAGCDALARVVTRTTLPVLAIGGVSLDRMARVAATGAAGFAAIALFRDTSVPELPGTIAEAQDAWRRAGGCG